MDILLFSQKTQKQYFLLPICACYTVISRDRDYYTEHRHPVYHFLMVVNGSGSLLGDAREYPLKEKDIAVVNPNRRHIFSSAAQEGMTYFTLNFYLLPLSDYLRLSQDAAWHQEANFAEINRYAETLPLAELFDFQMTDIYVNYNTAKWDEVLGRISSFSSTSAHYYNNIVRSWLDVSPTHTALYCNRGAKLLYELFALFQRDQMQQSDPCTDPLVARIVEVLEESMYEKYSLQRIADSLKYSRVYLCSYFSKKTGMTINEYLNRMKIAYACQFLRNTTKPVAEVASLLGYSSPNHFSRNFSVIKHVSPKEYRKNPEIL